MKKKAYFGQELKDLVASVKRQYVPPIASVRFTYKKHLSDDDGLIRYLADFAELSGKTALMKAACGSGKTYTMLSIIAGMTKKKSVLAVPNVVQAEQNVGYHFTENGHEYHTIAITGNSAGHIDMDKRNAVSAVYDVLYSRLRDVDSTSLKDVFLVIDEAQLLVDALSYRRQAIEGIEKAAAMVTAAGGCVLYMTGTPDKIMGMHFDYIIDCVHVDGSGMPVPTFAANKVTLYHKSADHGTIFSTADYIIEKLLIPAGKIPFVMLNDKVAISSLASHLRAMGLDVVTLTADEKGYLMVDCADDPGSMTREYENPAFGALLEKSILPSAAVYLVTSVVEVGTSIVGVQKADGVVVTPTSFYPLVIETRRTEFDIDRFVQFCNRARFHVNEAGLLCNVDETAEKEITFESVLEGTIADAQMSADAFNDAGYRVYTTTAQGQREIEGVALGKHGFYVNYAKAIAAARKRMCSVVTSYKGAVATLLRESIGVPVEEQYITPATTIKKETRRVLNGELITALESAAQSEDFWKAVTEPTQIDYHDSDVQTIKEADGGRYMLTLCRQIAVSEGDQMTHDDVIAAAMHIVGSTDRSFVTSAGREIVDLDADIQSGLYRQMAEFSTKEIQKVYEALTPSLFPDADSSLMTLSDKKRLLVTMARGEKTLRVALDIWAGFGRKDRRVGFSWNVIMQWASEHTAGQLQQIERNCNYAAWNRLTDTSDDYEMNVAPKTTLAGAQYDVIRHGGDFVYPPEEWAMSREKHAMNDLATDHLESRFSNGFIGKVITTYDMGQIAKQMNAVIFHACHRRYTATRYTAVDIYRLLTGIYSCERVAVSAAKKSNVKGADADDYICIRPKRLRTTAFLPPVKEQKPADKASVVAYYEHLLTDAHGEISKPEWALMLRQLTYAGYNADGVQKTGRELEKVRIPRNDSGVYAYINGTLTIYMQCVEQGFVPSYETYINTIIKSNLESHKLDGIQLQMLTDEGNLVDVYTDSDGHYRYIGATYIDDSGDEALDLTPRTVSVLPMTINVA